MKNILVPTDFSTKSHSAISYIFDFIIKTQLPARVYLLNAYMVLSSDVDNVIELNDEVKKESLSQLQSIQSQLNTEHQQKDLEIETILRMGSIKNLIPRVISEFKVDLLVMGEDDGRRIQEISKILKKSRSSCPLLTVYHYEEQAEEIS